MIRLPNVRLAAAHTTQLSVWQDGVTATGDYAAQIKAAEKQFSNRNKATNKTFAAVREALARMCSGARRCAYCEDSAGIEVEHMQPKSFYPELVFAFGNYVFACGRCNRFKSNRAAVLNAAGALIEIKRARNVPATPPPVGTAAFINPRREDAGRRQHVRQKAVRIGTGFEVEEDGAGQAGGLEVGPCVPPVQMPAGVDKAQAGLAEAGGEVGGRDQGRGHPPS